MTSLKHELSGDVMQAIANSSRIKSQTKLKGKHAFDAQAFLDSAGVARKIVPYRRSQKIYAQGDPATSVMYIQDGGVKLFVVNEVGKEAVVGDLADNFRVAVIHRESSASTHETAVAPIIGEQRQRWNECFLPPAATAASHTPPWLPSGGDRGHQCGKADTPRQVLEAWVIPQAVHARIYLKIDKPVGVLFVGFLQVFHSAVVFSQADVYPGEEEIGRASCRERV